MLRRFLMLAALLGAPAGAHAAPAGGGGNGYGTSFTPLGDLFGDGAGDFAVGAPFESHPGGTGSVFVYNGQRNVAPPFAPLATTLRSNQAGCQFGRSVSTAGDVNGDGFQDLLVGAPNYDIAGHNDCGRALLYLGSASGYPANPNWSFDTSEDGAWVGFCVAWAGDVNHDGYDDWLVGAPLHSNGATNEGIAYLFFGGAGPLSNVPAWSVESNKASGFWGWSVAGAGDVNADGYADFMVGAPGVDTPQVDAGLVALFLGSGTLPTQSSARSWSGSQLGEGMGTSVSTAGDVNGDGYSDFIVGSPFYTNNEASEGVAYLHLGGALPANYGIPQRIETTVANASFGSSVAPAGDTNGDGLADVVIGSPNRPAVDRQGAVYLYLGTSTGLAPQFYSALGPLDANTTLGRYVGTLGDCDGDGRSEWAGAQSSDVGPGRVVSEVGSPLYDNTTPFVAGQGYVPQRNWGRVGCTADTDGDGYDDLIVGSGRGGSDEYRGVLTLYRGGPRPFAPLGAHPYVGAAPNWSYEGSTGEYLGASLANAGDVNGDGYEDIIAGGSTFANGEAYEGEAVLFYGSPSGPGATPPWRVEGNNTFGYFGSSVTGGDLNGDGYDDVAVGAPGASAGAFEEGTVSVFQGSAQGLAHVPVTTLRGNQAQNEFGRSCAIVGDVNRDGFDDLVVGAPLHTDGQEREGKVYLYYGSPTGVHAPASQTLQIDAAGALFGWQTVRMGDINSDGFADLAIGAPNFNGGAVNEGKVLVYVGSPSGFVEPANWTRTSGQSGEQLGYAGIGAGDFDAAGGTDLLLGSPYRSGGIGGASAGEVRMFAAFAGSLTSFTLFYLQQIAPNMQLGTAVGAEGDFNGDGASDLFYTAPGASFLVGPEEGVVYVRYGNLAGQVGTDRPLQAWRVDGAAPIVAGLRSDATTAIRLKGTGRSAAGRTRLQLEWEIKPQGQPFDLNGRARTAWQAAGAVSGFGSGSAFNALAGGLTPATRYKWRARYRSASPWFPSTPWTSDTRRGSNERHFSTAGGQPPVAVEPAPAPALALAAPAPNPFRERATLSFALPRGGRAVLAIFDVQGRLVKTLFDGAAPAGRSVATWDGRDAHGRSVSAGAYFSRLAFEGEEAVGKLVRLR